MVKNDFIIAQQLDRRIQNPVARLHITHGPKHCVDNSSHTTRPIEFSVRSSYPCMLASCEQKRLNNRNAAASGLKSEKVLEILQRFSKYQLPQNIVADIQDWFFRYGKLKLEKIPDKEKSNGDDHQSTNIRYSSSASAFHTIDQQHHPQVNLLVLTSDDLLIILLKFFQLDM